MTVTRVTLVCSQECREKAVHREMECKGGLSSLCGWAPASRPHFVHQLHGLGQVPG
jgi:hypothetical protein